MAECDLTYGVPVVPDSDNFRADAPSECDDASESWACVLDAAGLHAPPYWAAARCT
ncbi:MAG: hypothetical protein ICV73_27425 [Acetobacteraceae bacterium]|nr:hypothetical protein [Acetobacteraceae bacterium]